MPELPVPRCLFSRAIPPRLLAWCVRGSLLLRCCVPRKILAGPPRVIACCGLVIGLAWPTPAAQAQGIPGQVVGGRDGTLHLLTEGARYSLLPGAASGADLGTISGALPYSALGALQEEGEGEGEQGEGEPGTPAPASAEPAGVLAPEPESGEEAQPGEAEPPPEDLGPPPLPVEAPVTLDGQSSMLSRPFALRGGEYAVSWTAQTSAPECTHNATLHASEDGRPVQPLGGGQVFGGAASGQTSLHDLPGASYYVDAISTCRWTITITPVP